MVSWLGGLIGFTIPTHAVVGVIFIILGVLIASFIPVFGKKFGITLFIIGLVVSLGFSLVIEWWQNDWFKIITIAVITFFVIWSILFPDDKVIRGGRR